MQITMQCIGVLWAALSVGLVLMILVDSYRAERSKAACDRNWPDFWRLVVAASLLALVLAIPLYVGILIEDLNKKPPRFF